MANAGKPKPFTVYLAGPMSGHENYNFDAFHKAARRLRELGVVVMSPAETGGSVKHMPRQWYFRFDFAVISNVDAVVVLPGWTESTGAKAEVIYAKEVGVPVYQFDESHGLGLEVRVKGWDVEWTIGPISKAWHDRVIPGKTSPFPEAFPA